MAGCGIIVPQERFVLKSRHQTFLRNVRNYFFAWLATHQWFRWNKIFLVAEHCIFNYGIKCGATLLMRLSHRGNRSVEKIKEMTRCTAGVTHKGLRWQGNQKTSITQIAAQ